MLFNHYKLRTLGNFGLKKIFTWLVTFLLLNLLINCRETISFKGEFTQYPFFVRFRPFFYVFASP